MTDDLWHVGALDLPAYLTRLGVTAREPSRDALDEIHEAHVRAFSFDNIDVLLGQHPGVALEDVQSKFVGRGRGGYCFEHATLFAAALERLGYEAERRLGRVGDPPTSGRTHCVVEVRLDGQRLLADPGFGISVLRPIPLEDGAEDDFRGWRHQVRRVDTEAGTTWELRRRRADGWELMHTTDELPVLPADLEVGHHFTSTHPGSHFTQHLMLTRHVDGSHTAIAFGSVIIRRPGEATEHHPLGDGELEHLLHELRIPVTAEEQSRLVNVVG